MKTNICISILLIIAIWIIGSIGLGILPLLPCMVDIEPDKINEMSLNLSYSYIAGCIVYFLTFRLPFLIKRNLSKRLIHITIWNFVVRISVVYGLYFRESQTEKYNSYFKQNPDFDILIRTFPDIQEINKDDLLEANIADMSDAYAEFVQNLLDLKEYLTEKQEKLLLEIRQNGIIVNIRQFHNHVSQKEFDKLMKLMSDLVKTLTIKKQEQNKNNLKTTQYE
jgi:hypothetical protein